MLLLIQIDLLHIVDVKAIGLLTFMEHGVGIPHDEHKVSIKKVQEKICQTLRTFTFCTTNDVSSSQASVGPSSLAYKYLHLFTFNICI
jgi:hypothetical protein